MSSIRQPVQPVNWSGRSSTAGTPMNVALQNVLSTSFSSSATSSDAEFSASRLCVASN